MPLRTLGIGRVFYDQRADGGGAKPPRKFPEYFLSQALSLIERSPSLKGKLRELIKRIPQRFESEAEFNRLADKLLEIHPYLMFMEIKGLVFIGAELFENPFYADNTRLLECEPETPSDLADLRQNDPEYGIRFQGKLFSFATEATSTPRSAKQAPFKLTRIGDTSYFLIRGKNGEQLKLAPDLTGFFSGERRGRKPIITLLYGQRRVREQYFVIKGDAHGEWTDGPWEGSFFRCLRKSLPEILEGLGNELKRKELTRDEKEFVEAIIEAIPGECVIWENGAPDDPYAEYPEEFSALDRVLDKITKLLRK